MEFLVVPKILSPIQTDCLILWVLLKDKIEVGSFEFNEVLS